MLTGKRHATTIMPVVIRTIDTTVNPVHRQGPFTGALSYLAHAIASPGPLGRLDALTSNMEYLGSISMPMNLRPRFAQATPRWCRNP